MLSFIFIDIRQGYGVEGVALYTKHVPGGDLKRGFSHILYDNRHSP